MSRQHFIFDIGNVLIDFLPPRYLRGLFRGEEIQRALLETIFHSAEWVALDRGTTTHAEATEAFVRRRPELAAEIRLAMANLRDMLTPIEPTIALLPRIKRGSHGLYFLSNYHAELAPHIQRKYDFFRLFDGGVFSCDVHSIKPEPQIYAALLDLYGLDPADCVFFDDVLENVDGARRAGIEGVLFRSVEDVEPFLMITARRGHSDG